jgi:SAM-dependent methyltransferase
MSSQPKTYQQSHHRTVTAAHSTRTAEVEGAFVLPHLKPTFSILDIGCGPGTITSGFATYVPEGSVTGIDTTTQVISEATERLSSLTPQPANVTFEVGNVLDGLRFPDASFDVVFCSQTLVHIVEPVKALKEMRRLCKPGGFVAAREGDMPFRWVPYLRGLQLFNKYLYLMVMGDIGVDTEHPDNAPFKEGHRSGSLVHVWAREAGFDPLKIVKGAKVTMYGTREERMLPPKLY